MGKLYKRESYLSKIRPFYKDEDMIKVLTGVRRCGKSSIMQLICNELIENNVSKENIVYINLFILVLTISHQVQQNTYQT